MRAIPARFFIADSRGAIGNHSGLERLHSQPGAIRWNVSVITSYSLRPERDVCFITFLSLLANAYRVGGALCFIFVK
ncbi:hypothetical protein Dda3937_04391 [Dickeya dadantii 3937]|uniref:Uncharacterized protein n=1 Tax=Dickeya dadantii (strain 3937) TaxID=198628 RepID=E0SDK5_DICD3|nr:hypothetical protein Dda3937_04391 [Dickeya dadantii 3937]